MFSVAMLKHITFYKKGLVIIYKTSDLPLRTEACIERVKLQPIHLNSGSFFPFMKKMFFS